jgi:hypothetical protein
LFTTIGSAKVKKANPLERPFVGSLMIVQ